MARALPTTAQPALAPRRDSSAAPDRRLPCRGSLGRPCRRVGGSAQADTARPSPRAWIVVIRERVPPRRPYRRRTRSAAFFAVEAIRAEAACAQGYSVPNTARPATIGGIVHGPGSTTATAPTPIRPTPTVVTTGLRTVAGTLAHRAASCERMAPFSQTATAPRGRWRAGKKPAGPASALRRLPPEGPQR